MKGVLLGTVDALAAAWPPGRVVVSEISGGLVDVTITLAIPAIAHDRIADRRCRMSLGGAAS